MTAKNSTANPEHRKGHPKHVRLNLIPKPVDRKNHHQGDGYHETNERTGQTTGMRHLR